MNELQQVFNYETLPVRTITDGIAVWFALIDVCKIFELTNPRMVAKRLDEDEVRKFNLRSLEGETWFVTESGLYTVILRSRSEKAKPFRRWVTHEVLPSIRKQGYYSRLSDHDLFTVLANKCIETGDTESVLATFSRKNIKNVVYNRRCLETSRLIARVGEHTCREDFINEFDRIWNGDVDGSNRHCMKMLKVATQLPLY